MARLCFVCPLSGDKLIWFVHRYFLLHGFSVSKLASELLKLFDARKLVNVFQAEADEEILGCLIKNWSADHLFAARRGDQFASHQAAENAT